MREPKDWAEVMGQGPNIVMDYTQALKEESRALRKENVLLRQRIRDLEHALDSKHLR